MAAKPRSGPAKSASAAVSNNSNRTSSRSGNPVVVCAKQECLQRTAANDIPAQISAPPQNFQSPPSAPPVYQPPRTYPDLEVISPAAEPTLAQNQEAIPTDAIPESSANMYSALNMLMTPPETEMSVATSGDSVPPETVSETTAPSAPIGDEEEAALLYSDDEEESEYGNITESGTEETPGKQKIRSRRKALLEHPPFEQIGPLKFYDLPRASIAGLKSLLKVRPVFSSFSRITTPRWTRLWEPS